MARTTYSAILPVAGCSIPAMITSIDLDQRVSAMEADAMNRGIGQIYHDAGRARLAARPHPRSMV